MDGNTTLIIIVALFVVVVIVWALLFRKKGSASIEAGPVKMNVSGEGSSSDKRDNPAPAHNAPAGESGGVKIEEAKAGGGILAEASDGGGVQMKKVEAGDDIIASASKSENDPKG